MILNMNIKNIIIFGAGSTGIRKYKKYKDFCNVIGFCDNDEGKQGGICEGITVYAPSSIMDLQFDYVLIASVQAAEII